VETWDLSHPERIAEKPMKPFIGKGFSDRQLQIRYPCGFGAPVEKFFI